MLLVQHKIDLLCVDLRLLSDLRHASHLFSLVVAPQFDRSPLVSFLYERGWRQNFNRSGFPGPDEEVICFSLESFLWFNGFLC